MTEEKYNTKDIRHIDEKNQEYIAEGNRMTEEIIIDGINVAGCGYYDARNDKGDWCDLTCTQEHAPFFRCESMPNCSYKQLQRLRQENKLKKIQNEELYSDLAVTNMKLGKYRSALEEIQRMVLAAWEQGKYLDGGLYNDLTNEFAKINEVLK